MQRDSPLGRNVSPMRRCCRLIICESSSLFMSCNSSRGKPLRFRSTAPLPLKDASLSSWLSKSSRLSFSSRSPAKISSEQVNRAGKEVVVLDGPLSVNSLSHVWRQTQVTTTTFEIQYVCQSVLQVGYRARNGIGPACYFISNSIFLGRALG